FYLAPPWDESPTPNGRIRLNMRPGYVFGSGDHPTTQLCLQLLEGVRPGRTLDVGSGTGILAVAALRLGAPFVAACDTDGEAVRATREGAAGVALWQGSTLACRSDVFNVVLANLPTGDLIDVLPELQRVVEQGGHAILSGFFEEQQTEVLAALGL